MKKIFLDINVVLDLLSKDRPFSQKSGEIFRHFLDENTQFCFSEDGLTTAYYIAKRSIVSESIIPFFEDFREENEILPFGNTVMEKSFEYCKKNTNADLEDVLQAFCAKENGCDFFLTSDKTFEEGIIDVIQVSSF